MSESTESDERIGSIPTSRRAEIETEEKSEKRKIPLTKTGFCITMIKAKKEKRKVDYTMDQTEIQKMTSLKDASARELAEAIAQVLDSKKGRDIQVLYVEDKTVIAEYFVLCTGNSSTQIKALAGEVEYRIGLREVQPYGIEGRDNHSWMLMDYSNVIVHIFSRESREFYDLDKLYAD